MKNLKIVVFSLLIAILFNPFSYSQMRQNPRSDGMRDMIKNKLQLTPEQEKTIAQLRLKHEQDLVDLTSSLKKKELEKEKILLGDVVKRDDILKVTKEIEEIKGKIGVERMNHQMDVYEQLDAKQKEIWKDMQLRKDKMKMRMKDGMRERMKNRTMDRMQPAPEDGPAPENE